MQRIDCGEQIDLTLPTGVISQSGRREINTYLQSLGLPRLPVWWEWISRKGGRGEYVGSFPKRVAKYYYQTVSFKLDPAQLGHIGSMVSRHTNRENWYCIDFTDSFDWQDGDFGDDDSCFWGGRSQARSDLESAGALAIRFYNADGYGIGRAWMLDKGPYWAVFNGYGVETPDCARILAYHLGLSYRKVSCDNRGDSTGLIYVNGGAGYIVGPEENVNGVDYVDLDVDTNETVCCVCGECVDEDGGIYSYDNDYYCESCYYDRFSHCEDCSETYPSDDFVEVTNHRGYAQYVCEYCADNYPECEDCNRRFATDCMNEIDGRAVCDDCASEYPTCEDCGDWCNTRQSDGRVICDDCWGKYIVCEECNTYSDYLTDLDGRAVCVACSVRLRSAGHQTPDTGSRSARSCGLYDLR